MRLPRGKLCPIHRRTNCCGREKCSPAEKRRRKDLLIKQHPFCIACHQRFEDYREVELAHLSGKGFGGGKIDDSMKNLALMHSSANREQGSMPLDVYLQTKWKPESCGLISAEEKEQEQI